VQKAWPDEELVKIIEKGPRSFVAPCSGIAPAAERGIELP